MPMWGFKIEADEEWGLLTKANKQEAGDYNPYPFFLAQICHLSDFLVV
jgi:hypothetical protein